MEFRHTVALNSDPALRNYHSGSTGNGAVLSLIDLTDIVVRPAPGHKPKIAFDGSGGISIKNVTRIEVFGLKLEGPNADITYDEAFADRLLHSNKYVRLVLSSTSGYYLGTFAQVAMCAIYLGFECRSCS